DADHYSPDSNFDPNGALDGGDNVRAGLPMTTVVSATPMDENFASSTTTVAMTGDGVKDKLRVGLRIDEIQPGNNWKIAAGLQSAEVNAVGLGADGQTLMAGVAAGSPAWPLSKSSPLLTVWRHAYVEIDRMADPILDAGPGRSKFTSGTALPTP